MEQLTIHDTSDETLSTLYTKFGIRAKEIGTIFGLTEDAILLRLKKAGIATLPRGTKRAEVEVHKTFQTTRRGQLTESILKDLLAQGKTKADIAREYLTSETTISRRLQKFSIVYEEKETKLSKLEAFSKEQLEQDYLRYNQEQFSAVYGCSRTVWLPYLESIGVARKSTLEPDPLTRDQKVIVLGSMLGDGSMSKGNTFYEFHCKEQEGYLREKHRILANVSNDVRECSEGGFRFETNPHRYFIEVSPLFYKEGVDGKHIPVDLYRENWDDRMLAIWYLDDGTYDHRTDSMSIANKCPDKSQLDELAAFLEGRYHFGFQVGGEEHSSEVYRLTISKLYYKEFFAIVASFATPDMLGKIPEEYLPAHKVEALASDPDMLYQHPALYRRMPDGEGKRQAMESFVGSLLKDGFPYPYQTQGRLEYYLREFLAVLPSFKGKVVMSRSGYGILDHFFPSQFDAHRKGFLSPAAEWSSEEFVRKVALEVLEGSPASNRSDILRKVRRLSRGAVTVQNPSISAHVYQNYNVNGLVLDTSAGFGARMLSALGLGLQYDGYEPNMATFSQLQNLGTWVKSATGKGSFNLWCSGSEDRKHAANKYGLAFTSPPYFDFEEYSSEGSQSTQKYPMLMSWLNGYWATTMRNAAAGLVPGGYFIVNLSPRSGGDIMLFSEGEAARCGLGLQGIDKVRYGGRHNGLIKEEWLLVFRKGFPCKYHTLTQDIERFR